jgi:hypothetical protein
LEDVTREVTGIAQLYFPEITQCPITSTRKQTEGQQAKPRPSVTTATTASTAAKRKGSHETLRVASFMNKSDPIY